jgi:hypothetical protein
MPFPDRLALIERGPDECWIWTGAKTPRGYGHFGRNGKDEYAHRAAYELRVGPIPPKHDLDHNCEHTSCCNPRHLTPRKRRAHILRHTQARTTCVRGHRLDVANAWHAFPNRKRACRLCYEGWNAVRWNPEEAALFRRLGRERLAESRKLRRHDVIADSDAAGFLKV